MNDIYQMMSTLRAVRRLRPDPIPDDVLDRVLQAAAWAPTGGNMQPLQARMDFELEQMSADFATEVEALANKEITASRNITAYILPRSEAFAIPDLIRTKINLLPENIPEVRVVNIEGLDLQADGGTHVANTQEVGTIKVVGHESKGRINKRLRIEITP